MAEIKQNFEIIDGKIIFNNQVIPPREGVLPRPKHPEKKPTEKIPRKRKPPQKRVVFIDSP